MGLAGSGWKGDRSWSEEERGLLSSVLLVPQFNRSSCQAGEELSQTPGWAYPRTVSRGGEPAQEADLSLRQQVRTELALGTVLQNSGRVASVSSTAYDGVQEALPQEGSPEQQLSCDGPGTC